jgi:hypothetical protein
MAFDLQSSIAIGLPILGTQKSAPPIEMTESGAKTPALFLPAQISDALKA